MRMYQSCFGNGVNIMSMEWCTYVLMRVLPTINICTHNKVSIIRYIISMKKVFNISCEKYQSRLDNGVHIITQYWLLGIK